MGSAIMTPLGNAELRRLATPLKIHRKKSNLYGLHYCIYGKGTITNLPENILTSI